MQSGLHLPKIGLCLAFLTFAVLMIAGVDFTLAVAVLIIWAGSLMLTSSKVPDQPTRVTKRPFTSANMKGLIERASTPLLITERNTIAQANRTARKLLGKHIMGQDARLVFRQPEAIKLIDSKRNGTAIARGLVRRRDIWKINQQSIDDDLTVIELINKTNEADVSRAHTDFVANASHELRTPLASIIGYVETLSDDPENIGTPIAQKFLGTIEREAKRLQHLVSDLMSLSRVEAEKHEEPVERIDLFSIIETAARDAAGAENRERLTLTLDTGFTILGDAQQLEQLVRNLVDNALKYGDEHGSVLVELEKTENERARLTVSNRGEGIAPEHIPHLTRRFYRTDPGRSRASGGTGLGLAIVKHIVERHRGRLQIESEQGKGTSVIVAFPLID